MANFRLQKNHCSFLERHEQETKRFVWTFVLEHACVSFHLSMSVLHVWLCVCLHVCACKCMGECVEGLSGVLCDNKLLLIIMNPILLDACYHYWMLSICRYYFCCSSWYIVQMHIDVVAPHYIRTDFHCVMMRICYILSIVLWRFDWACVLICNPGSSSMVTGYHCPQSASICVLLWPPAPQASTLLH